MDYNFKTLGQLFLSLRLCLSKIVKKTDGLLCFQNFTSCPDLGVLLGTFCVWTKVHLAQFCQKSKIPVPWALCSALLESSNTSRQDPGSIAWVLDFIQTRLFLSRLNEIKDPSDRLRFTCTSAMLFIAYMHFLQKDIHWWNWEEARRPFPWTPTRRWIKEMTRTHPNQSSDISISLIILANTWRSVAFPYTRVTRKAAKNLEQNSFFKSAHFIPTVSTNVFHSTNIFLFFTLPCSYR